MYQYNGIVWKAQLAPREKLVLLYLLDRADRLGTCWPSLNTIAQATGISRSGVIRSLKRLAEAGLVSWDNQGQGSNLYRIHLEALASISVEPGSATMTPGSATMTPPQYQGGTRVVSGWNPNLSFNHPKNFKNPPPISPPTAGPGEPTPSPEAVAAGGRAKSETQTPSPSRKEAPEPSITLPAAAPRRAPQMTPDEARTALEEHAPRRFPPPPQVPGEMVRALRDAGLWERFNALRRYARDNRSWHEWLAGPVAAHWRRLGDTFPQALGEALDGLASRPDLNRPLIWLERQLERATPPPPPQPQEKRLVDEIVKAPTLEEAIEQFLELAQEIRKQEVQNGAMA